ncbi:MAG: DNA protein [Acidobacteriota bacterium]|nr:DNA protein [Acidobacteriota bacterium]
MRINIDRNKEVNIPQASTVSVRTDKDLKKKVGKILNKLGLNHSTAINMYYRLILARNKIPFAVKPPNKVTLKALQDIEKGKNVKRFETPEELFKDLGILERMHGMQY